MAFQLVCTNCESIGIIIEDPEIAPPSTLVRCRQCEAVRGTIGELRDLAISHRRDLFDSAPG